MRQALGKGGQQHARARPGNAAGGQVVRAVHRHHRLAGARAAEHARGAGVGVLRHAALLRVDVHAPLVKAAGFDHAAQRVGFHVVHVGEFQLGGGFAQAGQQACVLRRFSFRRRDLAQPERLARFFHRVARRQREHRLVLPLRPGGQQRVQLVFGLERERLLGQRGVNAQLFPQQLGRVLAQHLTRGGRLLCDELRFHPLFLRNRPRLLRRHLARRLGGGFRLGPRVLHRRSTRGRLFLNQGGDAVDGVDVQAQPRRV